MLLPPSTPLTLVSLHFDMGGIFMLRLRAEVVRISYHMMSVDVFCSKDKGLVSFTNIAKEKFKNI